jgi:hypothetical protein
MATDFATTSARVIETVRGGRVFDFFATASAAAAAASAAA